MHITAKQYIIITTHQRAKQHRTHYNLEEAVFSFHFFLCAFALINALDTVSWLIECTFETKK